MTIDAEQFRPLIEDIAKYLDEFIYVPLYNKNSNIIIKVQKQPIDILYSYISLLEEIDKAKK